MTDTKTQLLAAAQVTFARFGYKKTTLDDIAKTFGKGKTSIYHYFGGKDDMYNAVLDKELQTITSALDEALNADLSPIDQLKVYVTARMKSIYNAKVLQQIIIHTNTTKQPAIIERLDEHRQRTLSKILENGIQQGIIEKLNVQLASTAIETALKGLETTFIVDNNTDQIDQRIDDLLKLLLFGLLRPIDIAVQTVEL